MIRCVRIWTAEDGNSSFEEGQIDLSGGARGDVLSAIVHRPASPSARPRRGGAFEWHDAPVRQFVLTLSGTLEFKTRRGDRFTFIPATCCSRRTPPAAATVGVSWTTSHGVAPMSSLRPGQSPVHSCGQLTANRRAL